MGFRSECRTRGRSTVFSWQWNQAIFLINFSWLHFTFNRMTRKLSDATRLVFFSEKSYTVDQGSTTHTQIAIHLHLDLEPLNLTHIHAHKSLSLFFLTYFTTYLFLPFFSKYTYTDAPAKLILLNCAFAFTCAFALSVCVYSRFHLIMALWRLNKKQSKTVAVKLSLYFAAIASTTYTHRHTATVATHLFIIQTANTVYAYNLCGRICLQHRFWLIKKRKYAWKINAFEDENAKRFYFCAQVIKGQDNLVSEPIDSELISRCVVCTRYLRFCPRFLLVNTKKALDDYSKWCATWKNVILILFLAELKRPNVRRKREKSSIPWKKWWRQCTK